MKDNNQEIFSVEENQPADWFEPLYAKSSTNGEGVPWANMETHPAFRTWLSQNQLEGNGKQALVVGCGMGDDAIELESHGFQVTAFDVSESAINYCKKRFPQSTVNFVQADLLVDKSQWQHKFDFVLEIYTVQALPPKYEDQVIQKIAGFVAPGGHIVVIAEVSNEERSFEKGPPWLLTPHHIETFKSCGLEVIKKFIKAGSKTNDDTYISTFKRL